MNASKCVTRHEMMRTDVVSMSREARIAHEHDQRRGEGRAGMHDHGFGAALDRASIRSAHFISEHVICENREFRLFHKDLDLHRAFCDLSHNFAAHEAS